MPSKRSRIHDRELKRLLAFIGIFGALSGASYVVPGLELVRPWVPGEPVPLVHLALDRAIVTENRLGEIVRKMPGEDSHDLEAEHDTGGPLEDEADGSPRPSPPEPTTAPDPAPDDRPSAADRPPALAASPAAPTPSAAPPPPLAGGDAGPTRHAPPSSAEPQRASTEVGVAGAATGSTPAEVPAATASARGPAPDLAETSELDVVASLAPAPDPAEHWTRAESDPDGMSLFDGMACLFDDAAAPSPTPGSAADGEAVAQASPPSGSAAPPSAAPAADLAALHVPEGPPRTAAAVVVTVPSTAPPERAAADDDVSRPGEGALRDRAPARGTPLEIPPGGLHAWFTSLAKAAAGTPGHIARALHWGDSTIAGDGITRTVRSRLQGRFGDGGPGFLAVQVDPRWASRPGVLRNAKGAWKTRTITFGGAGNKYYGLGGTVSTAYGKSSSTLGGSKVGDQRQALHRFDIAFQTRPDGGSLVVQVEGGEGATFQTASPTTGDAFHTLTAPSGAQKLHVATTGDGPVTVYGVSLETRGPGMTWETLGVAGAGQGSMFRQGENHLARQVAWRDPDLIVYQMGGNELGYPSLKTGGGRVWKERYVRVVRALRAGAPDASCLLITPLDQGERVRGTVRSKPTMATMVRLQREVSREMGCAFWDAQAAMGGSGSFGVWLNKKLAWSDLYHLTNKGLAIIGHTLADAMEAAYDEWRRGTASSAGSAARPSDG